MDLKLLECPDLNHSTNVTKNNQIDSISSKSFEVYLYLMYMNSFVTSWSRARWTARAIHDNAFENLLPDFQFLQFFPFAKYSISWSIALIGARPSAELIDKACSTSLDVENHLKASWSKVLIRWKFAPQDSPPYGGEYGPRSREG